MEKFKTRAFSNLAGSVIFIILGVWAYIKTGSFQEVKDTYVQASTFPRIMILGMLIFAVILFVQSLLAVIFKKGNKELFNNTESIDPRKKSVGAAYIVILLTVLFVLLFKPLGYVLSAFFISMAIMYLIGKRDLRIMIAASFLVPLCMWLIFYKVLTVNIPMGPLFFLRDLVDMI